jgi:hypothetical protein
MCTVLLPPGVNPIVVKYIYIHKLIDWLISIQPFGRFWQKPEPSQAAMALTRCILGKFLGVVFHCFSLPLDVPTFAARCLHVPNNANASSSERWNCGREMTPFLRHIKFFYMSQIYDMGPTALLPLRRKACWGFFRRKNPTVQPGLNPWTWVPEASMLNTRPPNPHIRIYHSSKQF